MAPGAQHLLPVLVLAPLIAWRAYSRIRRNIGRQKLGRWRPWVTLTIFPVIAVLITMTAFTQPLRLAAMFGGLAAGIVLGVFGTAHTRFENTPDGIFYTPHAHIGIAVSALFIGRVVWRMFELYSMDAGVQPHPRRFREQPGDACDLRFAGGVLRDLRRGPDPVPAPRRAGRDRLAMLPRAGVREPHHAGPPRTCQCLPLLVLM